MKAFTLLETVIYLALLTILIGGALVVAYGVERNQATDDASIQVSEEGAFVLDKIRYETEEGSSATFDIANGAIRIKRPHEAPAPLTSANVTASTLSITASEASFTLDDAEFSEPLP